MSSAFSYDPISHRYRDPEGRYISANRLGDMKERIISARERTVTDIVTRVAEHTITPEQFVLEMRATLKQATTMEYMLGRGGLNAMTVVDRGRVGGLLSGQYRHLNGFASEIGDGTLTRAQIDARAESYVNNVRTAYERGRASAWGIDLPQYPPLHSHCRCSLEIVYEGEGMSRTAVAYWRTSGGACPICVAYEADNSPTVINAPEFPA